jgi:hypothetical protein
MLAIHAAIITKAEAIVSIFIFNQTLSVFHVYRGSLTSSQELRVLSEVQSGLELELRFEDVQGVKCHLAVRVKGRHVKLAW